MNCWMSAVATIVLVCLLGRLSYGDDAALRILGSDTSGTALFFNDVILAYQLQAPNITLSMQTGSSTFNENLLFTNSVDFAVTSTLLSPLQQQLHPNTQALPFLASAIVPIYRLDFLGQSAPSVVFNRSVLPQIYAGEITWWNDSRIQESNPLVTMPNKTITLVLDTTESANNQIFLDALCQFYTSICSQIPTSILPSWPLQNYSNSVFAAGEVAVAATVTTLDNSMAYTVLSVALASLRSVGVMVNQAGYTVQASSSSVQFAMVELATSSVDGDINLNDASSASAWPINVMSYLLIDTQYTRDTCAIRRATVEFWYFIFKSSVVIKLAQSRQYAPLPDLLLQTFYGNGNLISSILCDGQPVVTGALQQQILIGGTNRLSFLTEMLVNLYNVPTDSTVYTYTPLTSQITIDKFESAELDVAFFYRSDLSSATIAGLDSSQEFLVIPAFLTSIAPIFNPQITSNVNLGSYSVIIDMGTYFRILFSKITDWKDPAIIKYNPSLVAKLGNQSAPITTIYGCQSTPIILQLVKWATVYGATFDVSITAFIKSVVSNVAILTGFKTCVPPKAYNIVYTPNEETTSSLVSTLIGSAGYTQDRGSSNSGRFTLMYPPYVDGALQSLGTSSSADSMIACVTDTFSVLNLSLNPQASGSSSCWPFTTASYLVVRKSYTAMATDTTECSRGLKALQFAQWLVTTQLLDATTRSQLSPRASVLPDIESAILDALNNVTCDGSTMLITLPVIWSLSVAVSAFGIAMSVIGLIGIFAALVTVALYWNNPVMRSASASFVFTSLSGVALMFIAVFFLVSEATVPHCNALSWFLNLGFMMTFAPLFAKTWRIYRIFGRKKLSVIKISNRKLAAMVTSFVSAEILLLSIWQAVSPLQPVITTQTIGSPAVEHQYTQCGTVDAGRSFLIVIGVTKGTLLLYGALLAFSTRRVTDHFNESQSIAWAIYNVVFSVGIVVPIIIFVGVAGDVMILLMLFVILWISYFTCLIIIVPKCMALFAAPTGLNASELSGTKSSVGGFSFLSIAEMNQVGLLHQYQAALRTQLAAVTKKLEQIVSPKQATIIQNRAKPVETSVLETQWAAGRTGHSESQISRRRSNTNTPVLSPTGSGALSPQMQDRARLASASRPTAEHVMLPLTSTASLPGECDPPTSESVLSLEGSDMVGALKPELRGRTSST